MNRKTEKYIRREDWANRVREKVAEMGGGTWHERSGIGAFQSSTDAMLGDVYLGSWDNDKNIGFA